MTRGGGVAWSPRRHCPAVLEQGQARLDRRLPPPTPNERIVAAIGRPRRVAPPRVVKVLLGLHHRLQTRRDETARLRRQRVLRAHQLEGVVDLSDHSRAVSEITEGAEMLCG